MAQRLHITPIGNRDESVLVEQLVDGNGGGFPDPTWEPLATVEMEKVDLIGNEAFRADQMTARYTVRFIGPYAPSLDPEAIDVPAKHRLRHRGRVYDITSAQIVGQFEGIEYDTITHTGTA